MVYVESWRECKGCHDRLPLDVHHFQPSHVRKDGGVNYRRTCRHCEVLAVQRRDRQLRTDPETREEYLTKRRTLYDQYVERHPDKEREWRASDRQRRKSPEAIARINSRRREKYAADREAMRARGREDYYRNREKRRQQLRESYLRRKADPERWARYRQMQKQWSDENRDRINENRRIWTRLKAEREGRQIRNRPTRTPELPESLPVVPLLTSIITRLVDAYGMANVEGLVPVSARVLWRIVHAEPNAVIAFDTGDQICCSLGYNLWDFWPEYA
jgi:hypothetical protein